MSFGTISRRLTRRRLRPALAHLHMPKAAGTDLAHTIERWLGPRCLVGWMDRSQAGAFEAFETMEPGVCASFHLGEDSFPPEADLIAGHFAFSTLRAHYPEARLMTVLREPAGRVLSHWFYLRG